MYDTKLKVLYDENIIHTLTVSGTISSDETSTKYLGERITIPLGEKEWNVPFVTISPDTVENTSTNPNVIEFIMPEEDVSINVEWKSIYLNIDKDDILKMNAVYANDTLKGLTADTPIDLVIPSTVNGINVTRIETNGFEKCAALRSVVIPEGVDSIGANSFTGCNSLTSITIPNSVTQIGANAFTRSALISLSIPDGIVEMPSLVGFCTSLTSFRVPRTIRLIESMSFMGCSSLPSIFIPKNVKKIDFSVFYLCNKLISISIENPKDSISGAPWDATNASIFWNATTEHGSPSTVTSSGEVSASDELKSLNENTQVDLVIPSTIDNITATKVGFQSFRNCSAIISVKLPNTITDIDVGAFQNCTSLMSINIPNGVTIIKDSTFDYCPKLESITIPSTVEEIGTQAFNDCTSLKSVTLNEGLKEIGTSAFGGCSSLSTLTIPKGVTYIDPSAFQNCTSLTSISVSGVEGSINGAPWGASNATVNWLG